MASGTDSRKIGRMVTAFLLVAIIVGGLVRIWPKYREGNTLREREAALAALIHERHQEIADLIASQRRFKTDPEFVELIARQNRRVYPGEIIFIFEKE